MELVTEYLYVRYTNQEALPFPDYLLPQNRHKNDFWITQEGECIYPFDMDDQHLLNTVRLIHRSNFRIKNQYRDSGADKHIKYGKTPWFSEDIYNLAIRRISEEAQYLEMWETHRIYMLLRREIQLRGLDDDL